MKKLFSINNFLFLLLFFFFISCVTAPQIKKSHKKPEEYEMFFCEQVKRETIKEGKWKGRKRGVPVNKIKKMVIGEGNEIFIFSYWYDLIPNTIYTIEYKWHDPNGRFIGMSRTDHHVPDYGYHTYNNANFKPGALSGFYSVKVFANESYICTKKFLLAKNETELIKLENKYAAILKEMELKETTHKKVPPVKLTSENKIIINRWSVIIGISSYKYSENDGMTDLIFADDDAKAFATVLKSLDWNENHIKLLVNEDATKRNITIALESWLTKAGPNDQIILFWAGHGFPDPEDPEKVYFACYDTEISIPATGYRMDKVRRALEERKAKNVILIADTCHAGKLITRGERGISIVPQIDKMKRERRVPKGWIFMVGADTDRRAIEHTSWTNGAFTHSLIKGLSGGADGFQSAGAKDGLVTMGELKDYMNISMPEETQKVLGVAKRPIITTSTGDPDIWNLTINAK